MMTYTLSPVISTIVQQNVSNVSQVMIIYIHMSGVCIDIRCVMIFTIILNELSQRHYIYIHCVDLLKDCTRSYRNNLQKRTIIYEI